MSKSKINKKYVKKTHYEHIVDVPDTYIGGIDLIEDTLNIIEGDGDNVKIVKKKIKYVPGLERIYEEILLNAFDQTVRPEENVTIIKVNINRESGEISIYNNGKGIPIREHEEYKVWIPTMIFSELLTSSNYDQKKKIVGGKNGYGAKLTNIFSKIFTIETVDNIEHKKFVMVCEDNMLKKGKPKITNNNGPPYVKITFMPDYEKFGLSGLTDDIYSLMIKRIYDISACSNKKVKVYFNNELIKEKTFEQYVNLYIGPKSEKVRIHEICGKRWEVIATITEGDTFEHVSFVNGICTKMGTHVNYIESQLTKKLKDMISKKNKNVKGSFIKNKLYLFIKSFIEDPGFNSQSKQELTTKKTKFGSTCELSNKFIKDFKSKTCIEQEVLSFTEYKDQRKLKKTDGKKTIKLTGIPKLEDANLAGSKNSHLCKLLLTEGDSARTFAISGLEIIGRDNYGVFPLKGKLLNVRQASKVQILKNDELTNLKQIIGLKQETKYTDLKQLRYGGIVILTDQDVDGSHIKGLLMNWIHLFWPELIELGFIVSMTTPIVKCFKKGNSKFIETFYTETEYEAWKKKNNNGKGWEIKYYKGLGTSTAKEAKGYFKDFEQKLIHYIDSDKTKDMVNLAFGKSKDYSNHRKEWLRNYVRSSIIEQSQKQVSIPDFVNKELIHFSNADNLRSIPHIMDGLKPSQRKVLFSALKKNLKKELKVAQFAGYVGEVSAYHHGDMSLIGTIIGMAQNYVNSNNINLLTPNGQFGTRYQNGKDHASARYIFTNLNPLTFEIFNTNDMPILNYLDDDGFQIEPEFYVPVIPMILINGCEGIGTGFSTYIQSYKLEDIIAALKAKIHGKTPKRLHPWYRGYSGSITYLGDQNPTDKGKYISSGCYEIIDEKKCIVEVSEIPIGVSTEKYKEDLEKLIVNKSKDIKTHVRTKQCITHFDNYSTESKVRFLIYFDKNKFPKYLKNSEKLIEILRLEKSISTNNMHLYNTNGIITKYANANEILDEYFEYRNEFYKTRKTYLLNKLDTDFKILNNKYLFVKKVIRGTIKVFKIKIAVVRQQLEDKGFEKFDLTNSGKKSYDYLTSMPVHNFTEEKWAELKEKRDIKKREWEELLEKTTEELWINDLDICLNLNKIYNKNLEKDRREEKAKKTKSKKKGRKR